MIEVFKTNVTRPVHAALIMATIRSVRNYYQVNFDLDDCDRIMRVKSSLNVVEEDLIIRILRSFGFEAQVLEDTSYQQNNNSVNHKKIL